MQLFVRLYGSLLCVFVLVFMSGSNVHAASYESVVGKINPAYETDFIRVAQPYVWGNKKTMLWMRREGYFAFVLMANEAKKAGVDLEIVSARRSYDDQTPLFVEYGLQRALPPGTSSHHYGHAIDLAHVTSGGKTDQRLQAHASRYGFCQSYDGTSSGQGEEPRHYEFDPGGFRSNLAQYRDELYLELTTTSLITPGTIDKKTLFDTYVYPYSHRCLDRYPSRLDDVISGIRFDRYLDSNAPEHLVYTLSRYKQTRGTGLLALLPHEIRFTKTGGTVAFTPLQLYPVHLQKAFRYHERFRTGLERLVLTRIKAELMQYDQTPEQLPQ